MVRLSYSKLNSFNTCPRQYYFSSVKKVPFKANKWMIAGSDVHKIYEDASLSPNYRQYITTHKDYEKYKVMMDNYIKYMQHIESRGESPRPKVAELKLYDKDLDFALIIDRIDVKMDGTTLLSDYKTDSKVNYDKHMNQLLLYAYFFQKHYDREIDYVGVYFCKHHKKLNRPVKVTKELVDDAMKWLLDTKEEIESLIDKPEEAYEAKTSRLCEYCSHREAGFCKPGMKYVEELYNNKSEPVETTLDEFE